MNLQKRMACITHTQRNGCAQKTGPHNKVQPEKHSPTSAEPRAAEAPASLGGAHCAGAGGRPPGRSRSWQRWALGRLAAAHAGERRHTPHRPGTRSPHRRRRAGEAAVLPPQQAQYFAALVPCKLRGKQLATQRASKRRRPLLLRHSAASSGQTLHAASAPPAALHRPRRLHPAAEGQG